MALPTDENSGMANAIPAIPLLPPLLMLPQTLVPLLQSDKKHPWLSFGYLFGMERWESKIGLKSQTGAGVSEVGGLKEIGMSHSSHWHGCWEHHKSQLPCMHKFTKVGI